MARRGTHPRAEPALWPVVAVAGLLAVQIVLLQVALNRLTWGLYGEVLPAVAGVLALYAVVWVTVRWV